MQRQQSHQDCKSAVVLIRVGCAQFQAGSMWTRFSICLCCVDSDCESTLCILRYSCLASLAQLLFIKTKKGCRTLGYGPRFVFGCRKHPVGMRRRPAPTLRSKTHPERRPIFNELARRRALQSEMLANALANFAVKCAAFGQSKLFVHQLVATEYGAIHARLAIGPKN